MRRNRDVALIIGANDVVNPVARNDNPARSTECPFSRRQGEERHRDQTWQGRGFLRNRERPVLLDNTRMLYGDAQKAGSELISGHQGGR